MLKSLLSELPAGKVPAKPFYYPKRPGCVRWILVTFTRNVYRASPAVTGIALGKNITSWLGGLFHANADAHLRTLDFRAFCIPGAAPCALQCGTAHHYMGKRSAVKRNHKYGI